MRTRPAHLFLLHLLLASVGVMLPGRVAAQTAQIFTTLHNLSSGGEEGGLVLSSNTLYGKASQGGSSGHGAIFAVNTDGTIYTNVYNFTNDVTGGGAYGWRAGFILSGNTLYGTTVGGGSGSNGTVFAVNTNGTGITNLHYFSPFSSNTNLQYNLYGTNVDGYGPATRLVLSGSTLYGTAQYGGDFGNGTIFAINTNGTGFTVLHHFSAFDQPTYTNNDGALPRAELILAGDTLYGTTSFGGVHGWGSVFAISTNTNGSGFRVLHSFPSFGGDGAAPLSGLVLSGDTLYGTTSQGGSFGGNGTLFAINTNGTGFTNIYQFDGSGGAAPLAALTLSGSTLYGTASVGGSFGNGTVFSCSTNGLGFTNLYNFTTLSNLTNNDGAGPNGGLILSGYTLYGATSSGGSFGEGTLFSVAMWPTVQFTASPTNAVAPPLTVQFNAGGTDSFGNSLTNWHWDFGDGSKSTAQNPSHTYTNLGTYSPVLVATNITGNPVMGVGPTITVAPTGVQDGGFETGDFTGWTLTGDTNNVFVDDGALSGFAPHSGSDEALMGTATTSSGFLSQTLNTTPGASYSLSFWFANPYPTPGAFNVSWNGNTLLDLTNPATNGWTSFQYAVMATGPSTVLQFGFSNIYAYFLLDDVSVVPSAQSQPLRITGVSVSGTNLVLNGTNGLSGATYYTLMSTNLTVSLNQWIPVATNVLNANGNFIITVTNAVNRNIPGGFYILQKQ